MDYTPVQLMHGTRLGMDDLVPDSKTIWLCVSRETCTATCPRDVDAAKVMDAVRITVLHPGIKPFVQDSSSSLSTSIT